MKQQDALFDIAVHSQLASKRCCTPDNPDDVCRVLRALEAGWVGRMLWCERYHGHLAVSTVCATLAEHQPLFSAGHACVWVLPAACTWWKAAGCP